MDEDYERYLPDLALDPTSKQYLDSLDNLLACIRSKDVYVLRNLSGLIILSFASRRTVVRLVKEYSELLMILNTTTGRELEIMLHSVIVTDDLDREYK